MGVLYHARRANFHGRPYFLFQFQTVLSASRRAIAVASPLVEHLPVPFGGDVIHDRISAQGLGREVILTPAIGDIVQGVLRRGRSIVKPPVQEIVLCTIYRTSSVREDRYRFHVQFTVPGDLFKRIYR